MTKFHATGWKGSPWMRGQNRGTRPKKDIILPLLACLTWKWLQIGTDMLLIITSTGNELLRNVNRDDLEWPWTPKIGGLVNFSRFWAATRISRVNCAEMDKDKPRQPAYEIFSIECSFQQSKFRPFRFRGLCTQVTKRGTLLKSCYLSAVVLSSMKMVADRHRHAA